MLSIYCRTGTGLIDIFRTNFDCYARRRADEQNLTSLGTGVTIPGIMADPKSASAGKINLEQVRHVARLARLELAPDEEEALRANLSQILTYIDQLNELDTEKVPPTLQVGEAGTPMRADEVTNRPAPDEMLANAPARTGHFFKVPKIIE
jgi:aspartyl-tRNA(Asn)/glutamyl-tRNA(Gln) amidotransferase subunit C